MRLIDADAFTEKLMGYKEQMKDQVAKMYIVGAIREIELLPTIEQPHWIPCSERLPEDLEEVNVTWVNHIPEPYYDFLKDKPFTGSAVYYRGEWFWDSSTCVDILAEYSTNNMDKIDDGIEITAWMPLPKPYGGESE